MIIIIIVINKQTFVKNNKRFHLSVKNEAVWLSLKYKTKNNKLLLLYYYYYSV